MKLKSLCTARETTNRVKKATYKRGKTLPVIPQIQDSCKTYRELKKLDTFNKDPIKKLASKMKTLHRRGTNGQ